MKKNAYFFLLIFLVQACGKGPETVIVQTDPLQPVEFEADTTRKEKEQSFLQLTIGETSPIESLDPLFAESNSELRIINLVYDGLVKLNDAGKPVPELARDWEVNRDSTRFVFHLNTDISFHSAAAFSGGVGRTISANDVRFAFERMASASVPGQTAEMFTGIRGFNEFRNEQVNVKNPAKRALDHISGIEVRNDSTVVFILKKTAKNFLQNLAHPSASIYARESLEDSNPPIQKAIGTGAFYFIKTNGNRQIFAVNENYHGQKPDLNRLDVISGVSEKDLFQMFARGEIDVLMEPSPDLMNTIAEADGELRPSYGGSFNVENSGRNSNYTIYFNAESDQQQMIAQTISGFNTDSLQENTVIDQFQKLNIEPDTLEGEASTSIVFAHTTNPSELYIINQLALQALKHNFSVVLNPSYSISEETTLSTRNFANAIPVLRWQVPVFYLAQSHIDGLSISQEAWNLNLTEIAVDGGR